MTNPVKGEVTFEVAGKPYTFKFGTNAQVIVEEHTKMTMLQYMKGMGDNFGAKDLRLIFFAGLSAHHQLSESECGDLIDVLGAERCAEIFMEAMGLAAPKGNGATDPTVPGHQAGRIGMNS